MSVAGWELVRKAVQASIALASQLDEAHVIWRWQNVGAPKLDYAEIALTGSRRIGMDFLEQDYDATRPAGEEVRLVVKGVREVMMEVAFYTKSTVPGSPGNSATVDGMDALGRASICESSLLLPSVRDPMGAVGVVPFDPQPIQNVPAVVSTGFRGRAVFPIRCYMGAQAVKEYVTWIQRAQGNITTEPGPKIWPFDTNARGPAR